MKNFPAPGLRQEGAVDREQDDERRRDVDRDPEDPLQGDEQVPDEPGEIVAAMRPGRRQIRPGHRVKDEQDGDDGHDRPGRAPRRLEQKHDEDAADDHVPAQRDGGAIGEIVAAGERVTECRDGEKTGDDVPPADTVAEARRHRKQKEAEQEDEGDVRVAQLLGRHDEIGRVEVEQAHGDGDEGRDVTGPSGQAVGRPLFGFDVGFSLAKSLRRDRRRLLVRRRPRFLRHGCPLAFLVARSRHAHPARPPRRRHRPVDRVIQAIPAALPWLRMIDALTRRPYVPSQQASR